MVVGGEGVVVVGIVVDVAVDDGRGEEGRATTYHQGKYLQ